MQRCFYSAVILKSVAVARAFSTAYVCGPVCWNVRFFGYERPHWWNVHVPAAHVLKNFEHPALSQFSMRHGCARFQFSELSESCTFRERIPEASGRCNNSVFPLFIAGSVSFESLIFSALHTLFLKKLYLYDFNLEPILQNLSSRTYPLEPILQNLSFRTYTIVP